MSSPRHLTKQTVTMDTSYTGIDDKIDTMKLRISGFIEIDEVDEFITRRYEVDNTRSKFTILHGCRYSFINKMVVTLNINKKYKNRDCVITYKYSFRDILVKNNIVIKISDGKAHPRVTVNDTKAYRYNFTNIKYTNRMSYWRNALNVIVRQKLINEHLTP